MGLGIAEEINRPGDDLLAGLAAFDDQADAILDSGRLHWIGEILLVDFRV